MLDLKSKLLALGLVTQEQVKKAEQEKTKRPKPRREFKQKPVDDFEQRQRHKQLEELKNMPKNEQYDLIRRWVSRNRLDKDNSAPLETSEKYFFNKADQSIGWLTLEPDVLAQINDGRAGIMAYMSNSGLAHCVVPKDIVEDVAHVFPEWARVLKTAS